jgi:long-chain acyl-CoA synthetase
MSAGFRPARRTGRPRYLANMLLHQFLQFHKHPNRNAVIEQSPFRVRKYSYADLELAVSNIAVSLQAMGLREGDKIILWGENSFRWLATFYACLRLKIVIVPMDAAFSQDYVNKIQNITKAKLICCDAEGNLWNDLLKGTGSLPNWPAEAPSNDSIVEIIFTSGTTGDPKGVLITHGNLLANLVPIHEEYQKYKRYQAPFAPIRFVHLIPLSHLFGQVMALFIPQMIGGTVIFTPTSALQVIQSVKSDRASVIVCVPQELLLLRKFVINKYSPADLHSTGSIPSRWWRYRKIHRAFGWKFWAFIIGGATLLVEDEQFWKKLGFAVVQGYGLTETAPSITITHPFKGMKAGFVGKKLPGLEVKIAEDGEILAKGPQISPGYFQGDPIYKDGWFHTGDLGKFDEEGNLQLLGRKKEVIVTSEGLNVFPQDVENVLNADPRVIESAVVAKESGSRSVVHAVLVLNPEVDAAEIIQSANGKLENFQRIQSHSVWHQSHLPRTSTGKLKRLAIAHGVVPTEETETVEDVARELLSGVASGKRLDDDLGLGSLDRVELLMDLESSGGVVIDESAFAKARTLRDVSQLMEKQNEVHQHYPYWDWPRWSPIRLLRYLLWGIIVFPTMPIRMKIHASGLENLRALHPPVFFVSNHQSILDAPAILKALPDFGWRKSLAPAMGAQRSMIDLYAAALFFNSYPLPPTSVGLRKAIELTGKLADEGYSPLVFPEGERTPDGRLRPFRPGIGVMVHHTKLPVVPIVLNGTYRIWPIHARGPTHKGIVDVQFHPPIDFSGKDPATITRDLEEFFNAKVAEYAEKRKGDRPDIGDRTDEEK